MTSVQMLYPGEALKKAIISRLRTNLTASVFDRHPNASLSRYIVVGMEQDAEDWSTKTRGGFEIVITLECRSRSRSGVGEVSTLAHDCIDQITATDIDISGDGFTASEAMVDSVRIINVNEHEHMALIELRWFVDQI